jgi:hypothetical protein
VDDGAFSAFTTISGESLTRTVFDSFIDEDRKYSYRIVAINSIGRSEPSEVRSIILHGPPNPPRNVTSTIGDGVVTINWIHPIPKRYSPVTNYNITCFLFNETWFPPSTVISANETSFTYHASNGIPVIARLWAHSDHGDSEYVEIARTPGRAPDPPVNAVSSFIDNGVNITWDQPLDDGGYQIIWYRIFRSVNSGEFEEIVYLNYLTFEFTDDNVEQGVSYEYFITAENVLGRSERSNSTTAFDPIIYYPPPAPEIYLTTKGILYIHIHWSLPKYEGPQITKFIVHRNWSEGGPDQNLSIDVNPVEFSYNDTDIVFDVNYTYMVTAVNDIGESNSSNIIDIRVRNLTEPAPNGTTKRENENRALIFGLIGAFVIIAMAGVVYFVMTKRGPYELPSEEFEIEPEELNSSIIIQD